MSKFEQEYAQSLAKGGPYDDLIRDAADRNGVSYDYLRKKIFAESRFDPNAKSATGPRGLGQFTALTGKAYGLNTDADFFDPAKSIDAAARHTADLLKTYNGDYLKTSLAYNQGQGRLGAPQLAAYDSGDFSKVGPEGLNYMRQLLDVAGDSPQADALRNYGGVSNPGITPKSDAVSFDAAMDGIGTGPLSAQRGVFPSTPGINIKGKPEEIGKSSTRMGFAEFGQLTGAEKAPPGWFEGTGDAVQAELATGTLGQIFRSAKMDIVDPAGWVKPYSREQFTDEDFQAIRDAGVDPQFFGFIVDQTKGNRALLANAVKLAKENMEYQKKIHGASTSAQIVAGFAGAGTDPFTYAPIPGAQGAKLISRVAQGAAYSGIAAMGSEGLREASTGIEASYGSALVGGALVGGALTALVDRVVQRAIPAQRLDMWDGDLQSVLARHQEAALPNEFAGPSMRLEARETARQTGTDDPTLMPWSGADEVMEWNGMRWTAHPTEPGSVRLADGSILSGGNPLNPAQIQEYARLDDKAAKGFTMGGFTEIGYTLTRSENPEVRDIGNMLFRSTTGMESGSAGRFGATASDVIERIKGQDHVTYNAMHKAAREVLKDPKYATAPGGRQAQLEEAYRTVAEAIEDSTGTLRGRLSGAELDLLDVVQGHFERKLDMLQNPAQFGNWRATSVLGETRHEGSYIPNVYSDAAKALNRTRFGGNDGLREAIVESWLASYSSRAAVKTRVDRMLTEEAISRGEVLDAAGLRAAVEDYARRKATGISHSEELNRSNLIDAGETGLVGSANNNFLEGRHLFDSDVKVGLSDGAEFSVNDLRDYDLGRLTPSYDRRVNGDIGIMAATGENTQALQDRINAFVKNGNEKSKEGKALMEAMKILTGQARRDPDGLLATAARSLSDMSFFAKNAYMGVQGISEVAGLVTKGHTRMLMKGVPFLKEMVGWGSKISPENLKEMHDLVFGRELDNLIRPSRQDIITRLRDHADAGPMGATVMGSIKWATGELSARSPWTKLLTESSNYIADAGRQGVLSELVNNVHGGTSQGFQKLFTPQRLKSMSITPEQFEGIRQLIRENTAMGPNGKVEITNPKAFQTDPRSMDIWRMGDKIADETILRPHKLSSQDTVAYGAGVKMAMQFKNFTMRSMNARLVRGYYDATKNGRAIDQSVQAVLSTGLALSTYVAMKYAQAQAIPKDEREKFLKAALDGNMLAYAAASRSSHIGAPLGLFNMISAPLGFDQAAMVRSSILPRGVKEKREGGPMKFSPAHSDQVGDFLGGVLEQVPGAGVVLSAGQAGYNAFGALKGQGRKADQEYMTGMYNGLRGLIPNDAASQKVLLMIMQDQGIEIR